MRDTTWSNQSVKVNLLINDLERHLHQVVVDRGSHAAPDNFIILRIDDAREGRVRHLLAIVDHRLLQLLKLEQGGHLRVERGAEDVVVVGLGLGRLRDYIRLHILLGLHW